MDMLGQHFRYSFILLIAAALPVWMTSSINAQQTPASATEGDQAKQLKAAIAELEQTVMTHPLNIGARMLLGNLYVRQGEIGRAIREFEQVIKLKPDHKPAYFEVVITYLELRQNAGAAEMTLEQALDHFPKDGALHSLMGHVQVVLAQRRFAENKLEAVSPKLTSARSHFQTAIDNLPNSDARAAAYLGLGSCYHTEADLLHFQKKPEEAAKAAKEAASAYRQAVALQPELRREIRELEIELAMPPPRFPETYSLTHLSVTIQERLRKIRAKLPSAETSNKGGAPK